MLPSSVAARLALHLERVRNQHQSDIDKGFGRVPLPDALARKYPNADRQWAWQFVFPATRICHDPRWGLPCRFHLHQSAVQRAVAAAVQEAGLAKRASCHTFRHSLAAGQVDAVFLTHLHSDHFVGIPDLWLTGWLVSSRTKAWPFFGPSGTVRMMDRLKEAFSVDLQTRV